jgi:hypothetical protein
MTWTTCFHDLDDIFLRPYQKMFLTHTTVSINRMAGFYDSDKCFYDPTISFFDSDHRNLSLGHTNLSYRSYKYMDSSIETYKNEYINQHDHINIEPLVFRDFEYN